MEVSAKSGNDRRECGHRVSKLERIVLKKVLSAGMSIPDFDSIALCFTTL